MLPKTADIPAMQHWCHSSRMPSSFSSSSSKKNHHQELLLKRHNFTTIITCILIKYLCHCMPS